VKTSRRATARILIGSLIIIAASAQLIASDTAKSLYKQGQAAEVRQDYDAAFHSYRKAMFEDPANLKYKTASERTRPLASELHVKRGKELRESGKVTGALAEFLRAAAIDPSNESAEQAIASLKDQITPAPQKSDIPQLPTERKRLASLAAPIDLKPISDELVTLHMVEDSKIIYESLAKAAGINVLFDPDLNSKRISVDLTNTSLEDALRIVATSSGAFWKPVTRSTIFVAGDTRVKRQQLEQQAIRVLYLANATQQSDLNDVQTALRNVLPNAKLYAVQSQDAIVMRGTPDELLLAEQLIDDLDKPRPEVMIDVTVLQVDRGKVRSIGLQWPQTLSVTLATPSSSSSSSSTLTLNDLANLNAKDCSLTVGTAQADMLLTDTDTQILQNPRLRAADAQKATMKIGERIPVATGPFSAPTGSSAANAAGYSDG
jgi:general secretion pathway protein D